MCPFCASYLCYRKGFGNLITSPRLHFFKSYVCNGCLYLPRNWCIVFCKRSLILTFLLLLFCSMRQENEPNGNVFVWLLKGILVSWLVVFCFSSYSEHGSSAWLTLFIICQKSMCKLGMSNVASFSSLFGVRLFW